MTLHTIESPEREFPLIADYGGVVCRAGVNAPPQITLAYKAVFGVSRSWPHADRVHPGLERVARFVNLLGTEGIRPYTGDVVVVFHGEATRCVLADAAYGESAGAGQTNANLVLASRLRATGVQPRVCSQALASQAIDPTTVDAGFQIDLAAMVTFATLQLRGYAHLSE